MIGSMMEGTKQRILYESIRLFGMYGYSNVSMRQIAHSAGIQGGSIYNHYSGKEEILDGVVDFCVDRNEHYRPSVDELKEMAGTHSAREVLERFNYSFDSEEIELLITCNRMIFSEQYKNRKLGRYLLDVIFDKQVQRVQEVLEYLMVIGKIPKNNAWGLATVWVHSSTAFSMKTSHVPLQGKELHDEWAQTMSFLVNDICGGGQRSHS